MAGDMHEPGKFPSLDSYQKRFLWTHEEVDLAPRPFVGLVLQAGNAEKFSQALGFEGLVPFLQERTKESSAKAWVKAMHKQ